MFWQAHSRMTATVWNNLHPVRRVRPRLSVLPGDCSGSLNVHKGATLYIRTPDWSMMDISGRGGYFRSDTRKLVPQTGSREKQRVDYSCWEFVEKEYERVEQHRLAGWVHGVSSGFVLAFCFYNGGVGQVGHHPTVSIWKWDFVTNCTFKMRPASSRSQTNTTSQCRVVNMLSAGKEY